MPTPVFNTSTYPKLQRKYKDIPNLAWILDNINTEFAHIFNLEALEECVGTNEETSPYFALFDECIQKVRTSGQNYYDTAEITNILAPWLFKKINDPFWSRQAFMVFDREMPSKRQMGFVEKFFNGALIPDLSNKEALEQYAFHTLDMLRSAACYKPAIVVELQHLSYLNLPSVTNPMFIRCRPKNKNGLPQWLTLYTNKKTHQMCVYSESPVDESDWNLLNTFLESKEINPNTITREGMKAGLSVSSGMRAVTKWNDQVGGAGFSLEADYPSLLVEWAWRTEVVSPYGISEKYQKKQANGYAESLSFGWTHFRNTMTQRRSDGSFVLMDVCTPAANPAYNDHLQMRSYNLGLDWLLADKQIKLLTIDDKKGTVHLKVPETLIINGTDVHYQGKSFSSIFGQYQPEIGTSYAAKAVIGFGGMVLTRRPDGSPSSGSAFSNTLEEATATGMALHVFRACAKQKTLSMEIPTKYRFNPDEISLIYMLMEQNPFVCELKVDNNHPDLIQLRDRLQHVFARNRWLNMSGYVPPLLDDFWDAAAHYWVGHLKINSQTLMDEKDSEQIEFRRCVNEMGLHGLKAALSYLQREEPNLNIDFYKLLQNKDAPPAFYAACAPADMKEYTNLLLQHLQGGRYFPFGQFHFRFVPGANGDILDLLGQLNTLRSFQRITLQDCLVDIPAFSGFLDAILERLKTDPSWSCPILMPELDVEHAFKNKEVLDLRKKYLNINNILMDRVRVKNSKELANIAFTEAVDLGAPVEEDAPAAPVAGGQPLPDQSKLKEEFNKALTAAGVVNFPINRAGGLALQMQQQQQIKQERSRCLDHETEKGTAYQDILPAHLVTYDNIDDILGDYFTQFQKDHTVDSSKAVLSGGTVLQNFFHTWVNANPEVNAKHIVYKMTPDAAKMLLKYHRQLSGGLNPYNLPKGFYTQRDAAGTLVLGYKSTLQYTTDNNPLTLRFLEKIPEPEVCPGDFRQFNLSKYTDGNIAWDDEDYAQLKLFSQLQPRPKDVEDQLKEFMLTHQSGLNNATKTLISGSKAAILDNWSLFYTLWTLKGEPGLREFFTLHKKKTHRLSAAEATALLLQKVTEPPKNWAVDVFSDIDPALYPKISVALGQVYFRYGAYGLTRLLTPLYRMQHFLGTVFFDDFLEGYLFQCDTFSPLMSESALQTFDKMTKLLSESPQAKALWTVFLKRHMGAVDWEDFTQLWKGFEYFYLTIQERELHDILTPSILDQVKPDKQNMLVLFDRILLCLEKIPNVQQQEAFLAALSDLDLTEGGVPYAIRHEGFVIADKSLQLQEFYKGKPTYAPNLKELNSWAGAEGTLFMHRALALQSGIKPIDYQYIIQNIIVDCSPQSKRKLLWVLHSQFGAVAELDILGTWNVDFFQDMAAHFHKVFYIDKIPTARFPLSLFKAIEPDFAGNKLQWRALLAKYANVMLLECINILHGQQALDAPAFDRLRALFDAAPASHPHLQQGLMLATVFGVGPAELQAFYAATLSLKGIVRQELSILSTQLLSLDIKTSADKLTPEIWSDIIQGIQEMNEHPAETAHYRMELFKALKTKGLIFKTSVSGDYRSVKDSDIQELSADFGFFEQHQERLKTFFKNHIVISEEKGARPSLMPIMDFFKRLQLNKTYINEVEPLLATLESILKDHPNIYWTAEYFNRLLRALQSTEESTAFPIAILEAVLKEKNSPFWPKGIDEIDLDFPKKLGEEFTFILSKAESFTREQQSMLARLALRANAVGQDTSLIRKITERLMLADFQPLRAQVLESLLQGNIDEIELNFARCTALLELAPGQPLAAHWTDTCQLWIETITRLPELNASLLEKAKELYADPEKLALVLHIVAWSSFPSDMLITAPRRNYIEKGKGDRSKTAKLVDRLQTLSMKDLRDLATKYPAKPAPDTKHLLDFIKVQTKESFQSSAAITPLVDAFLLNPYSVAAKRDYQQLAITRERDFQRMLEDTRITRGEENDHLSVEDSLRLTMMFKLLKQLESGQTRLPGVDTSISDMTQEELSEAFASLSQQAQLDPDNDVLCTQIWAVLFAVLGRTSGKYPHLAQQFSLIANEIALKNDPSSILQLKTGEGKSHFVAMRAARHVGLGKNVDVCTAKWSLAERDLIDYKPFFDYLNIRTANVKATSARSAYEQAQIVYTTPGDFSLFLDAQAFSGNPIKIDKNMRVGLGDEFDFLFYEGQKTQYNYAQHTGITPKEMVWFYRALNQFYDEKLYSEIEVDQAAGKQFNISADHLARCFDFLTSRVGTEEGLLLLDDFRKNPIELVGWLQSAHEAAKLKMGVQYTVRLERVKIGEEEYPLQEIYPLTKDMQAAVGSTFSHGVHQLVADRLNQVAKTQGLSQNYHVHPESNIVSSQVFSQRLRTLWGHWEGFTGTVSAAQAAQLHGGYGTAVLRVPTNQKDLRKWPDPTFCETPKERLEAMARTIKHALKEKKSILWCCKTDKEVTEMVDAIKPFFTKEEFDTYFMSYTNESQDSPADVLRQKKAKEGLVLGQKERGVVLIAAGFGRGDNVDVEMVLLGSVHDENDLGQKGGRTARNGEEGEVQQFYLRKEVDEAFFALLSLLPTHYPERRDEIITALMEKEADIGDQGFFDDKGQPTAAGVAALSSKFKFDTVLRLDEFLQSLENQASLAYHEAKAQLSSVAIAEIGSDKLDPSERKDKARSFANHLAELENQWIKIQADKASPKDRINALHHYLQGTLLKSLKHLFKLDKDFPFTREDPPGLTFLLEPQKKPRTEAERWLTEIQSHLLQIDDWPTDPALWKQVVTMLGGIAADYPHKLKDIYRLLQQEQSLTYNDFIGWVARVREQTLKPEYTNLVEEMKNVRTRKDKDIVQFLSEKDLALRVHACMIKLAPEVQQDALLYLQEVGLSSPEAHAVRTLPLLQYVSSMKPKQALQAASYFSHTMAMDTLLDLPPACFNLSTAMHADYLILVKKFLDRMLPKSTSAERYAASFQGIVNGCKHQTEKRLRWLATWEMMLSSSENKEALLETLTALMTQFEAPGHFMVFQTLLDKVSKAYIEPLSLDQRVVESTRLDAYWHSLLKQCPTILKALPVLEMALNQSGKEFFFCLETLSKVQAELIVDFQVPITSLWASSPGKTKKEKMEKYAGMLTLLQRWYKALPADKLGQYTIHHMQKLPSALFAQAINNWEKHEALFMETPLLFAYYVEYLNKETPSAEDSRVLQLLLKLGHAKLPAGHLEAYLFQLSKYREEPQQLSVFLDLVSWNDSSERKPEFEWQRVSELWLNTERVNKLTKLPAAVYGCLQPMMKSYGALFAQHPAALDALIAYMESAHFEAEHVERLCQVLKGAAKACRNDSKKMQDYATVLSVQFSDKAHMDCMFDLIDKYPEFMTEIASNGLVDHLKTVVGTEWDALSHEMIKDFYDARAKTMFSGLRKHFGEHSMFEDMGDSTDSQKRVACLHLLNKGAFLPKTSLPEAWSEKDNDTLLSDGLDHYTKYAAESLAPHKKHSHGAQKVRGLKKSQQVDLFRITKELKAIGTPSLHKAQALSDTLKKDIQKELKGYQKTWFKNTARKKQIVDIQEKLNDFLDNTKGQTASDNMYRDLLTEIMATKADIMKQDMDAVSSGSKMNMILRLFRPLHKKGHSRLYRTLNKIQDQVLKAWATDTKEVQSLQDYTFAAQQEMTQYADAFYKALEAWIVPVETLKENGMEKTANFLFFYRGRSRDEAVKELIGLIQEAEEKGDKDAISNTLHDNKELVSSLPGELRTLAKEVLARSKALRVDKGANPNG